MIKLIDKLEKSKAFWTLLVISIIFFLLRLPSLIEPNWYGDEGFYQVIGMALNNGSMLYSQIWDNKPPLLYVIYALVHGDQFGAKLISLIFGVFAIWVFYALSHKLFHNQKIKTIATAIFALLFGLPLLEGNIANAENFMLLPIIAAALLIYQSTNTQANHKPFAISNKLLLAGLLLGIAFLFKIVAIFDFAAFFVFLLMLSLPEKKLWSTKTLKQCAAYVKDHLFVLILGFLLPIVLTVLYFTLNHAFGDFIHATLLGNVGYVNYGNRLFIAQGFLIIKLVLLIAALSLLVVKRNILSKPALFILIWTAFSLFNTFFSQRPYTHYVLVMLPSFCLLLALTLKEHTTKIGKVFLLILIATLLVVVSTFKFHHSLKKTILYYQNAISFISGQKDTEAYQKFFDGKTPRDYSVASFLKMHTKPHERVFIWGDSPQIYVLSQTLPINKYPVAYHIRQSKEGMLLTQQAIDTVKPKFVVVLFESPNMPFDLKAYTSRFTLNRAAIYERTF